MCSAVWQQESVRNPIGIPIHEAHGALLADLVLSYLVSLRVDTPSLREESLLLRIQRVTIKNVKFICGNNMKYPL